LAVIDWVHPIGDVTFSDKQFGDQVGENTALVCELCK
jgi:hypothetical protein